MLRPGARLGPYEVLDALGAGGMGEVYRARDTKLGREVALKVLPDLCAADPDRIARFQREAQTLASLNHPNIAAIHGIEGTDGSSALVLELVRGETLAERISRGALPIDATLSIARQIIEALDAAHAQGIIHRDLKPANIKITSDGVVKLLDFGLAKLAEPSTSGVGGASIAVSQSPTITSPALTTQAGALMGTAAYMSPEQARGTAIDERADIWAFGCVVYEMVTGERLFAGETVSDVLSNVLTRSPDWSRVPASVGPLLQSCLERDRRRRLRDIGDAWRLIEPPSAPSPRVGRAWVAATLVTAVLGIAAFAWAWSRAPRPSAPPAQASVKLALDLGRDVSFATDFPVAALSPDGARIVFVSTASDGIARLSTRRLDGFDATVLPGTEHAYAPFFAPDSESVGFFAAGKLKKVRLDGGTAVSLCEAPAGRGASWTEDGRIVAALDNRRGLALVSASGGAVTPLTEFTQGELSHRWPQVLPGNKAVLFMVGHVPGNYSAASIAVASLDRAASGNKKILLPNAGLAPRYLSTGHLAYISNGALQAVPFDLDRLEVRGQPVAVLDDLWSSVGFGGAQLDVSQKGTALYRSGRTPGRTIPKWLDAKGNTRTLWDEPAVYQTPHVSPDGNRMVIARSEGFKQDLWVYDWQRGGTVRLTSGTGLPNSPIWSPDGQLIVFQTAGQLYWTRADGADSPKLLMKSDRGPLFATSFSRDGKRLLIFEQTADGSVIQVVAINAVSGELRAGEPQPFRRLSSANPFPAFSPDGRWIAYASAESGLYEVYVRAYPDNGRQGTISTGGGTFPVWSRSGRELFYRTEDQVLMSASYTVSNGGFVAARPRPWSPTRLFNTGLVQNFDVAPDGKQFVALMSAEPHGASVPHHVMLMLNFFDEVRRLTGSPKD